MSGYLLDKTPSILGGGMPGSVPLGNLGKITNIRVGHLQGGGAGPHSWTGMEGGGARGEARVILRQAFGNSRRNWASKGIGNGVSPLTYKNSICGQFRAAYSAGDLVTSLVGGGQAANPKYGIISNQLYGRTGARPHPGFPVTGDGVNKAGNATFVGNPKYVYDSSDFIKYKKLRAQNATYNDKSFGGDLKSGQYQATVLARVRM